MPTFNKVANDVVGSLKRLYHSTSETQSSAGGVEATKRVIEHILFQMASRWQRQTSGLDINISLELAKLFKMALDQALTVENLARHAKDFSKFKELHSQLQSLLAVKDPSNQSNVDKIREEMKLIRTKEISYWFETGLSHHIFLALIPYSYTEDRLSQGWRSLFTKMPPEDIALLITQVCHELIEQGLSIPDDPKDLCIFHWMNKQVLKEQVLRLKLDSFSIEQQQQLIALSEQILDPVNATPPDQPRFCINNGGMLRIFDHETLKGQLAANQSYRELIAAIDTSGPTGIDYILRHLPNERDDDPAATQAWDHVLLAWSNRFPRDELSSIEQTIPIHRQDRAKREVLRLHEQWLENTDQFLERCVWDALPEEVRQIPLLKDQLMDIEQADGDHANDISLIRTQLKTALAIRAAVNIDELKVAALPRAKTSIVLDVDVGGAHWCELLNYTPDHEARVISEEQLTILVNEAADALVTRGYTRRELDAQGQLTHHLTTRIEGQNKLRSNAEGNLQTQEIARGNSASLVESQIRDPLVRTLFIDVASSSDANDFCDIVVGACLLLADSTTSFVLPDTIQEYIDNKEPSRPSYKDDAKYKFVQFKIRHLQLSVEQMTMLERYHITPKHTDRFDLLPTQGRFAAPSPHVAISVLREEDAAASAIDDSQVVAYHV